MKFFGLFFPLLVACSSTGSADPLNDAGASFDGTAASDAHTDAATTDGHTDAATDANTPDVACVFDPCGLPQMDGGFFPPPPTCACGAPACDTCHGGWSCPACDAGAFEGGSDGGWTGDGGID